MRQFACRNFHVWAILRAFRCGGDRRAPIPASLSSGSCDKQALLAREALATLRVAPGGSRFRVAPTMLEWHVPCVLQRRGRLPPPGQHALLAGGLSCTGCCYHRLPTPKGAWQRSRSRRATPGSSCCGRRGIGFGTGSRQVTISVVWVAVVGRKGSASLAMSSARPSTRIAAYKVRGRPARQRASQSEQSHPNICSRSRTSDANTSHR